MTEKTQSTQQQDTAPLSLAMSSAILAQRCRENRDFAAALRANPRGVLEEMLRQSGVKSIVLPKNIVLWENTPDRWHLTVPNEEVVRQTEALADQTLPDEMLEEVQGGIFIAGFTVGITAVMAGLGITLTTHAGHAAAASIAATVASVAIPVAIAGAVAGGVAAAGAGAVTAAALAATGNI